MVAVQLGIEPGEGPDLSLLSLPETRGGEERNPASEHYSADVTAAERAELHTYFPGIADDKTFCISCGSYGHRATACPLQTCELCGADSSSHTKFGCPSRCRWCCTPGHVETVCKAKKAQAQLLAAQAPPRKRGDEEPRSPVPPSCLFCRADTGHIWGVCPTLWRTIVPDPTLPRTAKRLCMACYICGEGNHFGGDCPDNTGQHVSGRPYSRQDDIWSRAYCLQFTDLAEPIVRTNLATTADPGIPEPTELAGARAVAEALLSKGAPNTATGKNQAKSQAKRQAHNQANQKMPRKSQQQPQPQQQPQQQQKPKQKQKQKQKQLQSTLPTRPGPENIAPAAPSGSANKATTATAGKQPQDASQPQKTQPSQATARTRRAQRRRAQNKPKGGGDAKAVADAGKDGGQGGKQKKRNQRARPGPRQGGQGGQDGPS